MSSPSFKATPVTFLIKSEPTLRINTSQFTEIGNVLLVIVQQRPNCLPFRRPFFVFAVFITLAMQEYSYQHKYMEGEKGKRRDVDAHEL